MWLDWLNSAISGAAKGIKKSGPDILLGMGMAGAILSVFEAITATVRSTKEVEAFEAENDILIADMKPAEKVKTVCRLVGKNYIFTGVYMLGTTTALIFSGREYHKRNAAIVSAACALLEADNNYIRKLTDSIGEKEAEKIRHEIAEEAVKEKTPEEKAKPALPGIEELVPCLEMSTRRIFWSTKNKIESGIIGLNSSIVNGDMVSWSDWLDIFGLSGTGMSDRFFWDICDTGIIKYRIDSIIDEAGAPVLTVEFINRPKDHRW